MNFKIIILTMAVAGLSACTTLFERSEPSGYSDPNQQDGGSIQTFYQERYQKRQIEAREQLGISKSRTLEDSDLDAVRARMEVNKLERRLKYEAEKKQYYALKPFFKSDWQRAQFLRLPDREARDRYAQTYGITTEESKFDGLTSELIENSDISKGMSRTAVRQSWGEPDAVETAGNSVYGNERWIFKKLISTEEGYKHETRFVYFESGRVVGWETE